MINDKDFKALEQRVSELEDAHNQLCHHADWKEFGVAGKPTPEATLPICPHCNKPINKRRLASDVCMCEWKGVPSQPEATPRVSGTKDPTKDHVMTGIVEDGEEYCDSCNSWHVCQPEATPDPRCSRCDLPKSLHPLEKCKVFQLEATPKFNPYDYSDEADTQSDGHPAPQTETLEDMAEQLHIWYLEAIHGLGKQSFNSKAQKPYKDLSAEQKHIDQYIADKIISLIRQSDKGKTVTIDRKVAEEWVTKHHTDCYVERYTIPLAKAIRKALERKI
jgi:hypothetical protein